MIKVVKKVRKKGWSEVWWYSVCQSSIHSNYRECTTSLLLVHIGTFDHDCATHHKYLKYIQNCMTCSNTNAMCANTMLHHK